MTPPDRGDRLLAFERLLARPDDATLRARGHRLTVSGKRHRFRDTWLPAVRVWSERELAAHAGALNGWQSAVKTGLRKVLRAV